MQSSSAGRLSGDGPRCVTKGGRARTTTSGSLPSSRRAHQTSGGMEPRSPSRGIKISEPSPPRPAPRSRPSRTARTATSSANHDRGGHNTRSAENGAPRRRLLTNQHSYQPPIESKSQPCSETRRRRLPRPPQPTARYHKRAQAITTSTRQRRPTNATRPQDMRNTAAASRPRRAQGIARAQRVQTWGACPCQML